MAEHRSEAQSPPPRRWGIGPGVQDSVLPPPTCFEAPPGSKVVPRQISTPVHHFASGVRRAGWGPEVTLPPRVYVDQVTIFREISDVTQLRRGDHCMITLNILRCLSPRVDYFVSLLGSLEMLQLYHHFVVTDDVATVDANGVPRAKDGGVASIVEYANTIPEFYEEVRVASSGTWRLFPTELCKHLLRKAKCHRAALADYGDMPHIFRVEEKLSESDRERIVKDAERLLVDPPKYNIFWSNCEHTTNMVCARQEFTSPELHFVVWNFLRYGLAIVGLLVLHVMVMRCYSHYCLSYPMWTMLAYYSFTAVPVVLQSAIQFGRLVWATWRSYQDCTISRDDLYHLLVKEACRAVICCGTAVCIFRLATSAASYAAGGYLVSTIVSLGVVFAYLASDMAFGLCAQVAVRVLVRLHGRFWLHGGSPLTRDQEAELRASLEDRRQTKKSQ